MGIVIGEHRLIKEERRAGERLLGTVLLGRTLTHKLVHIHTLYVHTHACMHARRHTHTNTNTTSGIRDSLPLCVMASEADMAEWLS